MPPGLQVIPDSQLAQQAVSDVVVPASRIATAVAHTDMLEVENRNLAAAGLEPRSRRRDQARLAAAIRRQHVRVASTDRALVQEVVGPAAHIPGPHGVQGYAYAKKLARRIRPLPVRRGDLITRIFAHAVSSAVPRQSILALF